MRPNITRALLQLSNDTARLYHYTLMVCADILNAHVRQLILKKKTLHANRSIGETRPTQIKLVGQIVHLKWHILHTSRPEKKSRCHAVV